MTKFLHILNINNLSILGATKRIEPEVKELPVDGDLAASVGRYALYYVRDDNYKRCVIPLTTRLAATFRHGENKSIKKGDEIVIRSWSDKKFEVSTRAVKFIEELDTIILQSDGVDLCDKDLVFNSIEPRKGMHYLLVIFYQIKYFLNYLLKVHFFRWGIQLFMTRRIISRYLLELLLVI